MSIQFNLLPDIKIQYLKAKRQQHLVVLASIVAIILSLTVFILLISVVYGLQKKNLNDLNGDITSASNELKATKDLNKILTVQSQLGELPTLHDQKVVSGRLYDYLSQVTPASASLSKLSVDFALNTMSIAGSSENLAVVNSYIDTLKLTQYTTKTNKTKTKAFSEVVLSSFTRDDDSVTFEITLKFDPIIFKGTEDVTLSIPQDASNRIDVATPDELFQESGN
jgi:hypothetical protein